MKSKLRESRLSGGTKHKVARILEDVAHLPITLLPKNSSGAKIFAVWRNYPRPKGRAGRP